MIRSFTLEYWIDDHWYVGKLKEVPGIFSQGKTLDELEKNIEDAYRLVMSEDSQLPQFEVRTKEVQLEV